MRKFVVLLPVIFLLRSLQLSAQNISWTTRSAKARALADKASLHFENIEKETAYYYLSEALELDPDFTIAQLFMALVTVGDTRKNYEALARKSAVNKPEAEKLMVSLLDPAQTTEKRAEVWEKLHSKYPNNSLFYYYFANSRTSDEESLSAMQQYVKAFPNSPQGYNSLGYMNLSIAKDTLEAKKNFEKYIELYPDGCNPYDSMGDFYLATGDKEQAKKYFTKALEKYPFFVSSLQKLEELKQAEEDEKNKK